MNHTGLPIVVSLANMTSSFSCSITYNSKFKDFTVNYFHINLQGQGSQEEKLPCQPGPVIENRTYTLSCPVNLRLPDASATGTYYCVVRWPSYMVQGSGTFILVRDTGYQEPPPPPPSNQKALLCGFTGLLAVLSVLGTALLLWKKKQSLFPKKHPTQLSPDQRTASGATEPAAESVYTALQHRETEVYAYIDSKAGTPCPAQSPPSQEKEQQFQDDSEGNLVYENL